LRAIVVKCPQCGANLRVEEHLTSVTCQYCGTVASIQQRSRVFQVPQPLPPQAFYPPPQYPPQQLPYVPPIARQRVSALVFLVPIVMMVAAGGGASYLAMRGVAKGTQVAAKYQQVAKQRVDWYGAAPVTTDVDGDGTLDLVGFVHYVLDGDHAHLAAFSGTTGAPLWQSENLGKSSELNQADLGGAGDFVYWTSVDGVLHARDRKTGAIRWELSLGEKVESMCASPVAGEVTLVTADGQWWIVDATGQKRSTNPLLRLDSSGSKPDDVLKRFLAIGPDGAPGVCVNINTGAWQRPVGLLTLDSWSTLPKIEGMNVERLIRAAGGPTIAVGSKTPGTRVPMLARLDGKKVPWMIEIPSTDRLTASSEDHLAGMSSTAVYVLYQPRSSSGPTLLVAFELATGERLWEQEVKQGIGSLTVVGIVVTGDTVTVASWSALQGFATSDGAPRFVIGTP